jgi:hypothetical protein
MIMPILVVLFLGSFDAVRAIAIYMKVRAATYSLAAITNQYQTIASSDITSIAGGNVDYPCSIFARARRRDDFTNSDQ